MSDLPLKTQRRTITSDEIAQGRKNLEQYSTAREAAAEHVFEQADRWLAWEDDALASLVPDGRVPRAFNVGTAGCPVHGTAIYEVGGTYPWELDPRKPFQVTCPIGGESYPSNDFGAYYRAGLDDSSLLSGDHPDDGWGWVGPEGHRYWFVAYANHWTLLREVVPGVRALADAYLLTGDERYAHKAAVLLYRIAQVYPGLDYHAQSRYGQLSEAQGARYEGKLVNLIWETNVLTNLAVAYDAVWETIDGNEALQTWAGADGEGIRAAIERQLLEVGIQAIFDEQIRGNFGMHQQALVYAALVRDTTKTDAWIDKVFSGLGRSILNVGLDHALYNLAYRDGFPYETGPGYNFIWVSKLAGVGRALRNAEQSLFDEPKMRRIMEAPLDLVVIGRYTPSVGDSGSVYGSLVGDAARVYRTAFEHYGDTRFLRHLAVFGAVGEEGFAHGQSLFLPPLDPPDGVAVDAERFPVQASRLFDGYGMGILNNADDTIGLSLYYGQRGGHGHADRLHFDLYAHGLPMMPDLGYPDFMNNYVPGIYTWSKNTIAHNTVTVDARKQPNNVRGDVRGFIADTFVRVLDVEAAQTYPQCDTYRRVVMLVDVDPEHAYVVDVFDVRGGSQHDYSLHGPPGVSELAGGAWSDPAPGTLAGEDVAVGTIYDDPELGAPGFSGGYSNYAGSGFQHLEQPRRHEGGAWHADYTHQYPAYTPLAPGGHHEPDARRDLPEGDPARLRIRILDQPGQQVIAAEAQVSPVKHKQRLRYLIARRQGAEGLESRFVSVLEPYGEQPFIQDARVVDRYTEGGALVAVRRAAGLTDWVLVNPAGAERSVPDTPLRTSARYAVATLDGQGRLVRWFSAPATRPQGMPAEPLTERPALQGEVVAVDAARREVTVDTGAAGFEPDAWPGRVVHFASGGAIPRHTSHTVAAARRDEEGRAVLTMRDHLRIGRFRIGTVQPSAIGSPTLTAFAVAMDGAFISDDAGSLYVPMARLRRGVLHLEQPLPDDHPFEQDGEVWVLDVAPGVRCSSPSVITAGHTAGAPSR